MTDVSLKPAAAFTAAAASASSRRALLRPREGLWYLVACNVRTSTGYNHMPSLGSEVNPDQDPYGAALSHFRAYIVGQTESSVDKMGLISNLHSCFVSNPHNCIVSYHQPLFLLHGRREDLGARLGVGILHPLVELKNLLKLTLKHFHQLDSWNANLVVRTWRSSQNTLSVISSENCGLKFSLELVQKSMYQSLGDHLYDSTSYQRSQGS